MLKPTCKFGNN